MTRCGVLIIGAGLAGLSCARRLHESGIQFLIVEASDAVGGRARTDRCDGFLLDRGFHALVTSYPEALRSLDYERLRLASFDPGVIVRYEGEFHRMRDPFGGLVSNLLSPMGNILDDLRLSRLRQRILAGLPEELLTREETTTSQFLASRGFSPRMMDRFFRPFFGGLFLDSKLQTSSHCFEYVFRMLTEGPLSLPANGIQAIPEQLAEGLPRSSICLNRRVESIEGRAATLSDGEQIFAEAVVVATEGAEASRLVASLGPVPTRDCICCYFSAPQAPLLERCLVLNGTQGGPINHLAVLNIIQPSYSPPDENLISTTIIGQPTSDDRVLFSMVLGQLKRWFGLVVEEWRLLRTYRISRALPSIYPLPKQRQPRIAPGIYLAGDYRSMPSTHGAMESGRRAAESLLAELGIGRKTV